MKADTTTMLDTTTALTAQFETAALHAQKSHQFTGLHLSGLRPARA
jgi:hypothetical protein